MTNYRSLSKALLATAWVFAFALFFAQSEASAQTPGWASQTGYRYAQTPLQRAIVAAANRSVGQSSGQSVTGSTGWLTDASDGDGARMRAAISRYAYWLYNQPSRYTLVQVKTQMVGDFAGSAYDSTRKQALVNRIVEKVNEAVQNRSFRQPTNDDDTLRLLGIRKQCLEWAMTTAISAGGYAKGYSAAAVTSPSSYRPGMGLYKTNRSHAMIIVDIRWDRYGNPVEFKVVESNWGSGWMNPPGMVPWQRTVGARYGVTITGHKVVDFGVR
jgi:hypothetical protein